MTDANSPAEGASHREQLLAELRSQLGPNSETPQIQQFNATGQFRVRHVKDEFGSWTAGVKAAGGDPFSFRSVNRDTLLDALAELVIDGVPPSPQVIEQHSAHSIDDYEAEFGSYAAALDAAVTEGIIPESVEKDWEELHRAYLLADLRRHADGNDPPSKTTMGVNGLYGPNTYATMFGSWKTAVREAMGDVAASKVGDVAASKVKVWHREPDIDSTDDLLAEIRRLADGDEPPTAAEMNDEGAYSTESYDHHFGSWNAAIQQAMGGDVDVNKGKIPKDELLAEIRRLADGDDPPTVAEMDDEGQYSVSTYYRRFESWTNAITEAMGEDGELVGRRGKEIPEGELLAEIRRLADGDDPPTVAEMNDEGAYSAPTYHNHFGSWNAAIQQAMGGDVDVNKGKIPKDELLAEIRRLADGDDPPTVAEMDDEGQYSVLTYYRRFESWTNAVEQAMEGTENEQSE